MYHYCCDFIFYLQTAVALEHLLTLVIWRDREPHTRKWEIPMFLNPAAALIGVKNVDELDLLTTSLLRGQFSWNQHMKSATLSKLLYAHFIRTP